MQVLLKNVLQKKNFVVFISYTVCNQCHYLFNETTL